MIPSVVGRQGHFGEVTTDCRNSLYLDGEDRHEHKVWCSSAERHGDCLPWVDYKFSRRSISVRLIAPLNASFTETDDPTSGHDNNYGTPETGQHTALPASSVIRAIS